MQRVREIEPLIEGVERDEDRAAVFDRDMLDTREGLHDAGNLRGRKFVKSAHHPFEFEQDGDGDDDRSDSAETAAGYCFAASASFPSSMKKRASTLVSIAFIDYRRADVA